MIMMRSIYVLSDYGISMTILKNLFEKNISYIDIEFFGDMYLIENKISKSNIEKILTAMEKARTDTYQNSINELKLFGLTYDYYNRIVKKHITYESLRLSEKDFCEKFGEKSKFYHKLQDAYKLLINSNYNIPMKKDYSKYLLSLIKNKCEKKYNRIDEIYQIVKKTSYPLNYFYDDLDILKEQQLIKINKNEVKYIVPSLRKKLEKMKERTRNIIELRLSGLKLEDIGNKYGLTRERIRQIIEKEYNKFPLINEDKYKLFYEEYDFTEEEFTKIFLEPKQTYYYLADKYKKGNKDFFEIENDYLLPKDMVIRIKKLKNEIFINNEFIIGNRNGILKYILKKIDTDIRVDDLYDKFNSFLSNELKDYEVIGFDNIHNLEALLERKNWCISGANKKFRYYEEKRIENILLEELKTILVNTKGFYSTLYFYENHIDLMNELDIRNEQELHNFLRKFICDKRVNYLRMPNLLINCASKEEFIVSKIYEYTPMNLSEFCMMLRNNYGHKEDTMMTYLNMEFNKYITNGLLSVNIRELSYDESEEIMKELNKVLYTVDEIELMLRKLNIKNYKELINNLNLNKIGYKIIGPYVVKTSFNKLEDAFYKSVERGELNKKVVKTNSTSYLYILKLIREKKILDLENQYLPFNILYNLGISKEDIIEFENEVLKTFNRENEYFTVKNIRERIHCNLLNNFLLSNTIINSLIYSLVDYKKICWKDNIIYIKSSNPGSQVRFLECIIENQEGITLNNLQQSLISTYGINVSENDIKNIIYKSNIKCIDDKLYSDLGD